jgi:hypothetical protein
MTREFFEDNRDYLFCPNSECNAKIEYCSGNKRTFFRTAKAIVNGEEVIERHIEHCSYGLDHDQTSSPHIIYDPSLEVEISDKHLHDSLKRAFKKHKDPEFGKKNPSDKSKGVKSNRKSNDIEVRGKATISSSTNTAEATSTREPRINQRNVDDIKPRDYGEVVTVFGKIIAVHEFDNYYSLELETKDNKKARVFFGEQYKVNNAVQYEQLIYYKPFVESFFNNGVDCYGSFTGQIVNETDKGYEISVYISKYQAICIQENFHYQIYNQFNSKKY